MRVHIVGAGAIGGVCGAFLARAGRDVTLVDANAEHVTAVRERGLTITGATELTVRVRALTPVELEEELRLVLLAVKGRHTRNALATIAPRLRHDGCVVSMQNGLEEETIAATVGAARTVTALITFGGFYESPGVIRYAGPGTLELGELDGRDTRRVRELGALLDPVNPITVSDNVIGGLWTKAAISAAYFATAVADEDVPVLLADPGRRAVLGRLVAEVVRVARAVDVRCEVVDGFDAEAFVDGGDTEESWRAQRAYWHRNGQTRTGVWRDLAIHHRPTEVDYVLGPVLRRAARAGVAVPCLRVLVDAVHAAQEGRRMLGPSILDELAAAP